MVELLEAFRSILNVSAAEIQTKLKGTSLLNQIRHCKKRKMHTWSNGKHKLITDNDIDMKFGPDVNSAANSWKKN